jgi:hypothetical protein
MTAVGPKRVTGSFYQSGEAAEWDRFVAISANGNLLHTRRFLDHHGRRFRDLSLVFRDSRKGHLVGVFPIVGDEAGRPKGISHSGSSFGGIVTLSPDPILTAEMLNISSRLLLANGFTGLHYKTTLTAFHRQPDDTDMLFLTLAGHVAEFHLWSVIQVQQNFVVGERRRTAIRSTMRSGASVHETDVAGDYDTFYGMLERNLAERHERKPLHSFDQVMDLRERLAEHARLVIVSDGGSEMLAATWVWDYGNGVWHSQYICSTAGGRRRYAVDLLLSGCTELAMRHGQRIYSLGRSSLADGWHVNQGLVKFKKGLGCGLVAQRHIELDLTELARASKDWIAQCGD